MTVLFLLISSISFSQSSNELVGKWKFERIENMDDKFQKNFFSKIYRSFKFNLNGDLKCEVSHYKVKTKGTWFFIEEGNILSLTNGPNENRMEFEVLDLSSDFLVLKPIKLRSGKINISFEMIFKKK